MQSGSKSNVDLQDILNFSEESLQAVDVRTLVEFNDRVKKSVHELKDQYAKETADAVSAIKKETEEAITAFKKDMENNVQKTMEFYDKDIKQMQQKLKMQDRKLDIISGLLQQSYQVQQDLAKKIDSLELGNARRSGILTGLDFSTQKKQRIEQIEAFIADTIEVSIKVEDAYFLGDTIPRPVVIVFETYSDKQRVWKLKSQLRNYTGRNGAPIYLNEYLPKVENEKRRRERDIVADISLNSSGQSVTYAKDGLRIANEIYRKQVIVPSPGDLLDLSPTEFDSVMNIKTRKGNKIIIEDSVFIAYCIDAKDLQEVRRAYLKIKVLNARARHIVCAYSLPGPQRQKMIDYEDDMEHGAGRTVLTAMLENDVSHKAFYIARFCGQVKLGKKRLEGYLQAAENVLQSNPTNLLLDKEQSFNNERYKKAYLAMKQEKRKKEKNKDGDVEPKPTRAYIPREFGGAIRGRRQSTRKSHTSAPFNTWPDNQ